MTEKAIKASTLSRAALTKDGKEINNPVPLVLNSDLNRPPTIQEQIQRMIKVQISQDAMEKGQESYNEANDFNILDDFEVELNSVYQDIEPVEMTPEEPTEVEPAPIEPVPPEPEIAPEPDKTPTE